MTDEVAIEVKPLHACRCCLQRNPARNLMRPYVHQGKTEIYLSMLKDCFAVQLDVDSKECGICSVCVGRLRDANDFKLQVQHSQAELRAWLKTIEIQPVVKIEIDEEDDETSLNLLEVEFTPKPALADDAGTNEDFTLIAPNVKKEMYDESFGIVTEEACTSNTRKRSLTHISLTKRARTDAKQKPNSNEIVRKVSDSKLDQKTTKCFACDLCNKTFSQKGNLKSHQRQHSGEKPYACQMCDKKFANSTGLKVHQYHHTGEKPYSCDICNKRYTRMYQLKNHQRIHSGEKKPFSCKVCYKEFGRKFDLINHTKRVHTKEKNHACELCKKQFLRKYELTLHMTKHNGQQPFSCEFCYKKFMYITDLRRHTLIHTGEKPFTCDMCKARFTTKMSVKKHIVNKVCRK